MKTNQRRQDILAATRRVLRERGLHGIRVREVAAAAGMSPGSVIYHYRTTDDLLLAVHEDTQMKYLAIRTDSVRTGPGNSWDRLIASFKVGLPPYADGELIELLYEMHGLTRRSPRHAVLLTELWQAELELVVEVIKSGMVDGTFRVPDCRAAARALLALEDGLALHLVSDNEAMESSTALSTFIAAAAALLGVSDQEHHDQERTNAFGAHPILLKEEQ
ncbi:TetR/AcrR family transcriptional regulator [Rhodococcus sp. (in: high G+C Gram-positive bacteria)]|uniref:TetR/AcrR family transcriptional regulator n=1 Tax=Rhodococcus sp. TaxID=1831 RepID=UPI00257F689B|nr:TetR/AcrR family transcriptional regulator [Rhodococcus sp. (in: high G+C Gram-positive bacteria)]MBQ7803125.1 TetR/AcrR family transcriptional regulator [Rhodococcus sp. (in: high G+C Gram-positive bacteria)]